jgi:hypothetical protein
VNKANDGVIFTRKWVVEFMLDCCGYVPSKDLARTLIIEPSCGQGAFLLPIVKRLLSSAKSFDRDFAELMDSVCAFELNSKSLERCRTALMSLLEETGVGKSQAVSLLDTWLIEEDYLLYDTFHSADFVVGNPPYIRGVQIDRTLRERYMKSCQTMTAGTDVYVGFIERGLKNLKSDGILSFICADRWMHNAYGKKLRGFVVQGYSVDMILQMHGVDAFENDVAAYPAIMQISNMSQGEVVCAVVNETFSEESVPEFNDWLSRPRHTSYSNEDFSGYWFQKWFNDDEAWPIASPESIMLLEQLNSHYYPLQSEDTMTRVGIGIATGRDDVFILDDPMLVERSLLLPLVTSGQTRNGRIKREDVWLFNPWDSSGDLIDLNQYPLAKKYLMQRQKELRSRHVAKRGGERSWYRTIDKVYPGLVNKPKLLIQDMKSSIRPVYDKGDYYPHHNLYWITSERWNLEVLGGLLISDIVRAVVEAYCVKMRGGTLRLQAQYLRKIRLPDPDRIDVSLQEKLAEAFRNDDRESANKIARLVYDVERMPL